MDRSLRFAAISGLVLATGLGHAAMAIPAAQVDQELRPDFGALLRPPEHRPYRPRPWRHYQEPEVFYEYEYPAGPITQYVETAPQFAPQALTVDCADPRGGPEPLNRALSELAEGGVLYIRSHGGVCHETLEIVRPVVIVGEGASAFGPPEGPATLAPAPGAPCIRVARGVRGVEIRDLNLVADHAGRSACVESAGGELALNRVRMSYGGDASAVFAQGGRLILRESSIDARTNDAAVQTSRADVHFEALRVAADVRGLDITPGPGENSLNQIGVLVKPGRTPGSAGITVRSVQSGGGGLNIRNAVVGGFLTGIYVDRGAGVAISRSRIQGARYGVASDYGSVAIRESVVAAEGMGGFFAGSRPVLEYNRFIGPGPNFGPGINTPMESNRIYRWGEMPRGLIDERGFDDTALGWSADGYEQGYARDGAPRR